MAKPLLSTILLASAWLVGCSHTSVHDDASGKAQTTSINEFFNQREPASDPALPPLKKQSVAPAENKKFSAQKSQDGSVSYCGELHYGESNHFASDAVEVPYMMRLDCDSSGEVESKDGGHVAVFQGVKSQQKGWFTRWFQAAVKKHGRAGVPYICFKGAASADPCTVNKPVAIERASFSSARVDEILRTLRTMKQ